MTMALDPIKLESKKRMSKETERDLVPAGLTKPNRDPLPIIDAKYTAVRETLIKTVPQEVQCSMFCGGKKCKYDTSSAWSVEQMAIKGLYSHWVTEDVIAMARPNGQLIQKGQLIEQFKSMGIKSVINLQTPGEHASCGPKLDKSGFSYDPNDFMRNDIFFYNFAWKDYGVANMASMLDMVKVVSFATQEGKVAVHCHAGLGRTGVLIACYLVYYFRVRANDALRYLRLKRPGAVQTRRQIDCVKEFETFFLPQCLVFSTRSAGDIDRKNGRFTLDQYLKRQKALIHGFEARTLKYIPKLIFKVCERLLKVCGGSPLYDVEEGNFTKLFVAFKFDNKGNKLFSNVKDPTLERLTPSDSMIVTRRSSRSMNVMSTDDESSGFPSPNRPGSETNSYIQSCSSALSGVDDKKLDEILADGVHNQNLEENQVTRVLHSHQDHQRALLNENVPKYTPEMVYQALLDSHGEKLRAEEGNWATENSKLLKQYKTDLNYKLKAWDDIESETNLFVLTGLLLEWLEHLKHPIMDKDSITFVVIHCDNIEAAMKRLPNNVCYILEYLVRFVARLQPLSRQQSEDIMNRLMASLTHQSTTIKGEKYPSGKNFPKLRGGTADSTSKFMMKLFSAVIQPSSGDALSNLRMMKHMNSSFSMSASSLSSGSPKTSVTSSNQSTNNNNNDNHLSNNQQHVNALVHGPTSSDSPSTNESSQTQSMASLNAYRVTVTERKDSSDVSIDVDKDDQILVEEEYDNHMG